MQEIVKQQIVRVRMLLGKEMSDQLTDEQIAKALAWQHPSIAAEYLYYVMTGERKRIR